MTPPFSPFGALLRAAGFRASLVNMGEFSALGGPFHLLLDTPKGQMGQITLTDRALATSALDALLLGKVSHILGPAHQLPIWSSVTVEARSAALADACSTAFCLLPAAQIAKVKAALNLDRVFLVSREGDLHQI